MNSITKRFFQAAETSDVGAMRQAIADGADVGARTLIGRQAIHFAAESGNPAAVSMLVKFGADVNAKDTAGKTPLSSAFDSAVVEALVKAGANVDARDNWGITPLMDAAAAGNVATLEALLDCGAVVDTATDDGWTAVIWAARAGRQETLMRLLERGAAVPPLSKAKWTLERVLYVGRGGEETAQCAIALLSAMGLSASDMRALTDPTRCSAAAAAVAQLEAIMLSRPKVDSEAAPAVV